MSGPVSVAHPRSFLSKFVGPGAERHMRYGNAMCAVGMTCALCPASKVREGASLYFKVDSAFLCYFCWVSCPNLLLFSCISPCMVLVAIFSPQGVPVRANMERPEFAALCVFVSLCV